MALLSELKPGAIVEGLAPGGAAKVVQVEQFSDEAVKVTFEDAAGAVRNRMVFGNEVPALQIVIAGRPWSYDGDGALLRLVSEAYRIRLAHLFDPYLAVHSSRIEPLPHQITAVYAEMLPRQPLRFLLADDFLSPPASRRNGPHHGLRAAPKGPQGRRRTGAAHTKLQRLCGRRFIQRHRYAGGRGRGLFVRRAGQRRRRLFAIRAGHWIRRPARSAERRGGEGRKRSVLDGRNGNAQAVRTCRLSGRNAARGRFPA